jgi:hypothetical protein
MLLHYLKTVFVVIGFLCLLPLSTVAKPTERTRIVALCDQLYGPVIDQRVKLYAVNQFFVLQLIFDRRDHLIAVHVEPKWFWDWYNVAWQAGDDFRNLSKPEFERLLADIDRLKARGTLTKPASANPEIRNLTTWHRETYTDAWLEWGAVADPQRPSDAPLLIRWFNLYYVQQRTQHNKSLDRSHGNPDASGIKRAPAKVLGSAVARSTQPFAFLSFQMVRDN